MQRRYTFGALLTSGIVLALYLKRVVTSSFLIGERVEVIPRFIFPLPTSS
jgi:hypothetical protein